MMQRVYLEFSSHLPPKFFLQLGVGNLDHRGATVGAGVGEVALGEVAQEVFDFLEHEGVARFDGVAADGGGDGGFVEAAPTRSRGKGEFVHDVEEDLLEGEVADAFLAEADEEVGERFDEVGVLAEGFDADADAAELVEVFAQEGGVAVAELDGFGEEEALGGDGGGVEAGEHLFEEDAFVRGVLVDDDEAFGAFGEDVEFADDAEDAEGGGGADGNQRGGRRDET